MTDKEIAQKLKELADAPYGAAANWIVKNVDPYWGEDSEKKKYEVEIFQRRIFSATVTVEACCEDEAVDIVKAMGELDLNYSDTLGREYDDDEIIAREKDA